MKCTKQFRAVMPGDVYPTTFEVGADLDGHALEIAKQMNAVAPEQRKTPRNNKAARPNGNK